MGTTIRGRSKITAKGQTTVQKCVRRALGVSYGGEIAYVIDAHGVRLTRVETQEETDSVIEGFLSFFARDMRQRPQAIAVFPAEVVERMAALTAGIDIDTDAEIDGPVAR